MFNGYRISVWDEGKVLERISGEGHNVVKVLSAAEPYVFVFVFDSADVLLFGVKC